MARIEPSSIRYVETHGTATPLGDAIEIAALNEVFGFVPERQGTVGLGAVKANLGHTEAAAGIAGLVKAVLALKHRKMPPVPGTAPPNAQLNLERTVFHLNRQLRDWPADGLPARASVSSFGIGGTNAHVVMEEALGIAPARNLAGEHLLIVSAHSQEALRNVCRNVAAHLSAHPSDLADVAYTLQVGRAAHPVREFVVCADGEDGARLLRERATMNELPRIQNGAGNSVVFLCPDGSFEAEYEMARKWQSWGVSPSLMIGNEQLIDVLDGAPKIILEVGPPSELMSRIERSPAARGHTLIRCDDLLQAVGQLWKTGVAIDWRAFNAGKTFRRMALPTYPFDRQTYWIDAPDPTARTAGEKARNSPDPSDWFYVPIWKQKPALVAADSVTTNCAILLSHPGPIEDALAETLSRRCRRVVRINPTFDATKSDEYSAMLERLEEQGVEPELIVHAWQVPAASDDLTLGLYSVLHLCQALMERKRRTPVDLVLLTHAAHAVIGSELRVPSSAMLPAVVPVIARECPEIRCRGIDVALPSDPAGLPGAFAGALRTELSIAMPEALVAYRDRSRWTRSYEKLPPIKETVGNVPLRPGGVYLISGGLGGIGLTLASHLGRRLKAKLVLLGRSAFPERNEWEDSTDETVRKMLALERDGAEVLVLRADITDAAQVERAVSCTVSRFGALHGVIHSAGIPAGGIISLKTQESMQKVIAPKVIGTRLLHEAARPLKPDFMLLCSSIASVLAPAGQYDYCAANAFQDAFAHAHDSVSQTRVIAVNWDAWKSVGMAVKEGGELREGLSCEEGAEVFDLALRNPRPQWVISTRNLHEALGTSNGHRAETHPPDTATHPDSSLGESTEDALARIWNDLLGVQPASTEDDFFELGGDSLLAVELGARIESRFGRSVPMRQLLTTTTIAGMAGLLGAGNGRA